MNEQDHVSWAFELAGGDQIAANGLPAAIALRIEERAADWGWPVGHLIGTESDFMREFSLGRYTMREAIRILQGRGSVRAIRGQRGGLVIAEPDIERVASSLAMYLRSIGCTLEDAKFVVEEFGRSEVPKIAKLLPLCQIVIDLLSRLDALNEPDHHDDPGRSSQPCQTRAMTIALQLLPEIRSKFCGRLGTEWELCERFSTCQETMRQALRILGDLDLLEFRRGRTGGIFIRQPQPIGVVRQLFAFFAAQHFDQNSTTTMISMLNIFHLRLGIARLKAMTPEDRMLLWVEAERFMDGNDDKTRFVKLRQFVGAIAANPLIDTLLRCLFVYSARVAPESRSTAVFYGEVRHIEEALLDAFFGLREEQAVHLHGVAYDHISQRQI